jgi:two-component system, response regulator PdtaR
MMAPAPEARKSPACVLVVEDEILIRVLISDELRAESFLVIEAATADEALSYFQAGVQVDLVLSDIDLPGALNGVDLIERLRAEAPDLPTVLTSGHSPGVHAADAFLPKPYDVGQAVALVAALLQKETR